MWFCACVLLCASRMHVHGYPGARGDCHIEWASVVFPRATDHIFPHWSPDLEMVENGENNDTISRSASGPTTIGTGDQLDTSDGLARRPERVPEGIQPAPLPSVSTSSETVTDPLATVQPAAAASSAVPSISLPSLGSLPSNPPDVMSAEPHPKSAAKTPSRKGEQGLAKTSSRSAQITGTSKPLKINPKT